MTRRELVWAATVGVVLADSSVVTLALPDILRELDTSVLAVSWVLTSFNVVLAVAVLPAALAAARGGVERAAQAWVAGVVVFGLASLVCAVAPGLGVLLAGRCLQALGGAFVVAGAIELLARSRGSHARAAAVWGAAGLAGLAIGPAAGGLLTELITWEAIFVVQVPVLAAAAVAARPPSGAAERGRAGRIDVAPELALGLVSAGLTGALFLLVVMLTEGWGHSPLEAALIVTAMPVATVAASFAARGRAGGRAVMAAGAVALAGGLAALGLLPEASPAWTLAPQALVGAGIALVLPGLTGLALGGADPAGRRAAGTVAARHAGIVVGLLLLTPLFTGELTDQQRAAERSGTALLLDADLPPRTKIELGAAIARRVDRAGGRLPDVSPAFRAVTPPAGSRAEFERLERRLVDEVDRAATHAFSTVFLVAGGLALLAVVPIALAGGTAPRRRTGLVVLGGAVAACAVVIGVQLASGGASYEPLPVADPCRPRPSTQSDALQRIALSGLDGAACRLRVTREELVLALADDDAREEFARAHGIGDDELEDAVRAGLSRAIADAEQRGELSDLEAGLLRRGLEVLPVATIIDALQTDTGRSLLEQLAGRLGLP